MSNYYILLSDLKIPNYVKDKDFINLMKMMLNKNPIARMYKLEFIKKHAWFYGFDWEELINLSTIPPYIPKIKKNDSKSNCSLVEFLSVNYFMKLDEK